MQHQEHTEGLNCFEQQPLTPVWKQHLLEGGSEECPWNILYGAAGIKFCIGRSRGKAVSNSKHANMTCMPGLFNIREQYCVWFKGGDKNLTKKQTSVRSCATESSSVCMEEILYFQIWIIPVLRWEHCLLYIIHSIQQTYQNLTNDLRRTHLSITQNMHSKMQIPILQRRQA